MCASPSKMYIFVGEKFPEKEKEKGIEGERKRKE